MANTREQANPGVSANDTLVDERSPVAEIDEPVTIERRPASAGSAIRAHIGHADTALAASNTGKSSQPGAVDAAPAPISDAGFAARYAQRSLLGEGGMGEVRLCRDQRIGREVAMKVIRPGVGSRSDVRARFEREARVQGQLEHPAIVPVYDLGVAPEGNAYFTMKRVRGHTFEEIVQGLREGDPTFVDRYSTRKILTAFTQVGLAIAFAHARGVLHRDLKPANVMLGDYGEVYVLDWGLAKIAGHADLPLDPDSTGETPSTAISGATATGTVMGTPGYMAPEQVRGETDKLDARTDVYALGAILFEILTLTPLHDRSAPPEMTLVATVAGVEARPSVRAPDRAVPPELEAICVRALALDPKDRHETVRALVREVESYLDGDRDLERRRELAAAHAEAASKAAETALFGGAESHGARADAIREVNRALALDPTHSGAVATMLRLLMEPPKEVPAEAEAELDEAIDVERRTSMRVGALAYLSWFLVAPFVFWQGIRSLGCALLFGGLIALSSFSSWLLSLRRKQYVFGQGLVVLAISTAAIAVSALHFGPFIDVPGLAAANTLVFAMYAKPGAQRKTTIAMGSLGVLVPFALELIGWLPPSAIFRDGTMTILPRMTSFPAMPTMMLFVVASVALIAVPALFVGRLHDHANRANRRLFSHLWHLRQLIPDGARSAAKVPTEQEIAHECVFENARRALSA